MINDLKKELKSLITRNLRIANKETHFDIINAWITTEFGGFFTKDIVFEVIDELCQLSITM